MKASDLMIRDWICADGTNVKISSVDIHCVGYAIERNGTIHLRASGSDNLTPIPLTAEILKKNGFKEKEKEDSFIYHKGKEKTFQYIYISLENNEALLEIITGNFTVILEPCQLYVHELQHALRVCGLNKEADNFKI